MNKTNEYHDFLLKQAVDRTLEMKDSDGRIHYRDVIILLAHYSSDYDKLFKNHFLKYVDEAMLHLSTNEDIDGCNMSESDAYNCLKQIIPKPSFDDMFD